MPVIAASVSTRVVSWNEAADRKLSVVSDALVMPSSTVAAVAGSPPWLTTSAFIRPKSAASISSPGSSPVSPGSSIRTRRSIWRTMISTCLSLISTPCER